MAETNILNPINWVALGLPFNPNPSYGFSRRMSNNRLMQRPRLGSFISRDVGNAGHVFPLTWVNTDLTTAQRVTKFYHDFKHGYFTFINPDWGGRHFVGRFTSEPEAVEVANGKWTIQGCTFEEVPTARMLTYPNDWTNDGHPLNIVDDFFANGTPKTTVAFMLGTWVLDQFDFAAAYGGGLSPTTDPTTYLGANVTPTAGDWAQAQYTGWGFRQTFLLANIYGIVHILLDGVQIITSLDLSNGTYTASSSLVTLTVQTGPPHLVTVSITNVPLDIHLVKVVAVATASAGGGVSAQFGPLAYMY